MTAPDAVVDGKQADWDFGDLAAGPSRFGEQHRALSHFIRNFVCHLGVSVSERGLDVLELSEARLHVWIWRLFVQR